MLCKSLNVLHLSSAHPRVAVRFHIVATLENLGRQRRAQGQRVQERTIVAGKRHDLVRYETTCVR